MATLYVKQQGAALSLDGQRIVVRQGVQQLASLPIAQVERVVLLGSVHVSAALTGQLLRRCIDTVFMSAHGRYRGRLQPAENSHAQLRRRQYQAAAEPASCLALARHFVGAKLRTSAALLGRRGGEAAPAAGALNRLADRCVATDSLERLRGVEGTASRLYFAQFGRLLGSGFRFSGRQQHPPPDPVNALLSLGYTLLHADVLAACQLVGLDPYVGFYHQARRGHATLASDLMEEFRAAVVDAVVLRLCNTGTVAPSSFVRRGAAVTLKEDALASYFAEYERRLETEVLVPLVERRYPYRGALEQQARGLAAFLLGQRATYTPFTLRR